MRNSSEGQSLNSQDTYQALTISAMRSGFLHCLICSKKRCCFCNFGQYTVAHFYRLPTTQSPNFVSSQIKNFLENTNSRYSRKLRPANVQKRKQKCSEKKSLLTDNLVTRVSNVCADVLILGNLVSALSLY